MFYVVVTKDDSQAIYKYDTKREADAKYHYELWYANDQNITTMCVVMDGEGAVYRSEKYTKPVEEAEE